MNEPINYPLSKLLKQKGFDMYDGAFYDEIYGKSKLPDLHGTMYYAQHKGWKGVIAAPTIGDVLEWIYEKHKLWISVSSCMDIEMDFRKVKKGTFSFSYMLNQTTEKNYIKHFNKSIIWEKGFKTPAEAYEAGIEYVLTKLI